MNHSNRVRLDNLDEETAYIVKDWLERTLDINDFECKLLYSTLYFGSFEISIHFKNEEDFLLFKLTYNQLFLD